MSILLLLVSGQWGQTIHMLDINDIIVTDNGFTFVITITHSLSLSLLRTLAIVLLQLVRSILRKLSLLGKTSLNFSSAMWNLLKKWDTLTHWVQQVMAQAGLDVSKFPPLSTRAASVSAAHKASVNLDDILKTAGWSSECCFAKYYNKPIVKVSTSAHAVLSAK